MRLDYFLYMAEACGMENLVNTKMTHINAAIKDLRKAAHQGKNINILVEDILHNHGLNLNELSQKELDYIKKEVEK